MKSKRVSSKGDFAKIVLTETAPYEVPILFSNFDYYNFIRRKGYESLPFPLNDVFQGITGKKPRYTIPFDFEIKKDASESRKLSLIHPFSQYNFISFYRNYKEVVVDRCSVSGFSLRHPAAVAKYYFERDFALNLHSDEAHSVEEDLVVDGKQAKTASSFFSYRKYNFIYKFYESSEFHFLEKNYKKLMKFDVSKEPLNNPSNLA